MTARHHHFLPQCYLKGFTSERSRKPKLAVIDFNEYKVFETIPRNVGGVRDFNRVEKEGLDPNFLEKELAKLDEQFAIALKNLRKTLDFSGETRGIILRSITLIACRSPKRREWLGQIDNQLLKSMISMAFDKDIWKNEIHDMKENDTLKDISYEDVKKFFEAEKYDIEVSRESHICTEMGLVDTISSYLFSRQWSLLIADEKSGPFITTDNPVNLSWKYPEKVPLNCPYSPGFGLKETRVYFPISQELALIGVFDGNEKTMNATEAIVATFNSNMLFDRYKQIYAPTFDFKFMVKENNILSGKEFLKSI